MKNENIFSWRRFLMNTGKAGLGCVLAMPALAAENDRVNFAGFLCRQKMPALHGYKNTIQYYLT